MNAMKKPVIKFVVRCVSGSICAFLLGVFLWIFREGLASMEFIWETTLGSWILNYDHFMLFIVLLGLPIGAAGGIVLLGKLLMGYEPNLIAIAIGILFGTSSLLLIFWIPARLGLELERLVPGYEIIGNNILIVLLPLTVGLFVAIGHDIALEYIGKHRAK